MGLFRKFGGLIMEKPKIYYWCSKSESTFEQVSKNVADFLSAHGEFITTSMATAAFFYL